MYALIQMLIRGDVDTVRVFGPFDSEDAARSLARHHGWTRDDYRIRHLEQVEGFTIQQDSAATVEP